jgi:hypothetical protein
LISDYLYRANLAVDRECGTESVLSDFVRQIPNVDVLHYTSFGADSLPEANTFPILSEPFLVAPLKGRPSAARKKEELKYQ